MSKPNTETVPIMRSNNGSYAIDDALFLDGKDTRLMLYLLFGYGPRDDESMRVAARNSLADMLIFHYDRQRLARLRDTGLTLPPL